MAERKLFLQVQCSIIILPNVDNMSAMPITKIMQVVASIQVCLVSWMNINYKEKWWKEKLFLQIQSIKIMYPNMQNMIVVPITKRMMIIAGIQVFSFLE